MPARSTAGIGSRRVAMTRKLQVDRWLFLLQRRPFVWGPVREPGTGADEGGARCSVLRVRALGSRKGVHAGSSSGEDLENFIASASIWAKLGRAYGGCLGARSR